jgi:hypothetical protein
MRHRTRTLEWRLLFAASLGAMAFAPCRHGTVHVSGIIRDESGAVLPRARVACAATRWSDDCHSGSTHPYETMTDSSGHYDLTFPTGGFPLIVLHPNQALFQRPEAITMDTILYDRQHLDHQFRLYHVHGHVLGVDSLPLPHGFVTYYPYYPGMFCGTGLPEATIKDGSFEALCQPYPEYVFSARISLASYESVPSLHPHVAIQGDTTITLVFAGFDVRGTVRTRGGRPLPNAAVYASGPSASAQASTDSLGRYHMLLPNGRYDLTLSNARREYQQSIHLGSSEISGPRQVDLNPEYIEWVGRIRDAVSGEPLDSIRVGAEALGPPYGSTAASMTGPDGRFRLYIHRGSRVDIQLSDLHAEGHPMPAAEDPQQAWARIEREFARVIHRTINGVTAWSDSTFEILMQPIRK